MARKYRNYIGDSIGSDQVPDQLKPNYLDKQQFAARLDRARQAKNWSQSELAREATKMLSGGKPVSRDDISRYVNGLSFPGPAKLNAIAAALGMEPETLLPNIAQNAIAADEHPSFVMKAIESAPGVAWVSVNRLVKLSTATRIATLLEEDMAANADNAHPKGRR